MTTSTPPIEVGDLVMPTKASGLPRRPMRVLKINAAIHDDWDTGACATATLEGESIKQPFLNQLVRIPDDDPRQSWRLISRKTAERLQAKGLEVWGFRSPKPFDSTNGTQVSLDRFRGFAPWKIVNTRSSERDRHDFRYYLPREPWAPEVKATEAPSLDIEAERTRLLRAVVALCRRLNISDGTHDLMTAFSNLDAFEREHPVKP